MDLAREAIHNTKGLSHKQILIPMNEINWDRVLNQADVHVGILNSNLKGIKSTISIDCIRPSWNGLTISTSNVAQVSNLTIIEKYFRNIEDLAQEKSSFVACLLQSKSYLKILDTLYFANNSSNPINNMQIEQAISYCSLFKNITLTNRPWVIQALKNSDMSII